jgi:Bacterial extracellular solute-binding proteins, family 5 Middle
VTRWGRRLAGSLALASVLPACTHHPGRGGLVAPPSTASPSTTTTEVVSHPRGGTARVGVWEQPDVGAPTLGGAAVRALVLPQLFVAQPDGSWAPSLVAPGSDRLAADARSASFRLRPGATWSDGSPITVDDLRASADKRFVAGVDGPGAGGVVTIRFTQPLPGWRRLWSGVDSVAAPRPGLWGGPFVVAGSTPGLEVVLRRNDHWYGGAGPFLDEVRLVLVPDPVTAQQLLARGQLDAVMPLPVTNRTAQLSGLAGVSVDRGPAGGGSGGGGGAGGWFVALDLPGRRLSADARRAVVATVDRQAFVATVLRDEAVALDGFAAPGADSTWAAGGAPSSLAPLAGAGTISLAGELEEPMTGLLERSMQKRARPASGTLELRNAEADRVEGWVRDRVVDAAIVADYDGPVVCWTCRWAGVDASLAAAADAGSVPSALALEARLRSDALVLPLWRAVPEVAFRTGLHGVRANRFGLSAAWNAWEWWRG